MSLARAPRLLAPSPKPRSGATDSRWPKQWWIRDRAGYPSDLLRGCGSVPVSAYRPVQFHRRAHIDAARRHIAASRDALVCVLPFVVFCGVFLCVFFLFWVCFFVLGWFVVCFVCCWFVCWLF